MSLGLSRLTIDLDALAQNWSSLAALVAPANCSAVVKANAYGLGVREVSQRLYKEGCRAFFVASLEEGKELKAYLSAEADIYLLSGIGLGEESECLELGLIPVLVSLSMLRRWVAACHKVEQNTGRNVRSALKLDTGMHRLGFSEAEFKGLLVEPELILSAGIELVMSHLACADEPQHPSNALQLECFNKYKKQIAIIKPDLQFSLANSAACLLGAEYHFDMVRPGVALYGSRPTDSFDSFIHPVVALTLQVRQLRWLMQGQSIGYGASFTAECDQLVAVAAGGYADGLLRSLAGKAEARFEGVCLPMLGRVSMDSVCFDVSSTALTLESDVSGLSVELVGEGQSIDAFAESAGTIAYEVLTALSARFSRVYLGLVSSMASE